MTTPRWTLVIIATLILLPVTLNAIMLLPEVRMAIPSQNDDAMHFLFVQRASEALSKGYNPFDFWVPDLGYGFPQFHYYQHLPHLAVVFLHRILLKQIDLLTLFNLIRYLLLVGFPFTVYWSMRTMEFSPVGSAMAAAFASLMSGYFAVFGFEYESYLWDGYGMYTQLWAMHLLFIWLACIQRLLRRGTHYFGSVIASATLVLSHPFYAYMAAATTIAVLVVNIGVRPNAILRCMLRLGIVAALAMMITAYFWLPFLLLRAYFSVAHGGLYGPTLSQTAMHIPRLHPVVVPRSPLLLTMRLAWYLLKSWRVAAIAVLIILGMSTAFSLRTTPAMLAVSIFTLWLLLFLSPLLAARLAAALPLREALDFRRFVGGIDLGVILLVGAAGEWLWLRFERFPEPWSAILPGMILLILLFPQLHERWVRNARDASMMEAAVPEIGAGSDLGRIVETLKTQPSARVFLPKLAEGMVLTFYGIPTTYAGQMLSLNSMLPFDSIDPLYCDIFNVGYLVLPAFGPVPNFLIPVPGTGEFVLYRTPTSSYAQFGSVRWGSLNRHGLLHSQQLLYANNYKWLHDGDAAAGKFIRWNFPDRGPQVGDAGPGSPDSGTITNEQVSSQQIDVTVDCREAATLIFKITYHPNWHVLIDGREQSAFMVSPSYLAVVVLAGHHEIRAEYRSSKLKKILLIFGAFILSATTLFRNRLRLIEDFPMFHV